MKKIIDRITPDFIKKYNDYLLKNNPLGWQLQLPTITWLWLLITIITLPLPFLYTLDHAGDDDIEGMILISVLTGVLESGFFLYILIQFNNLKSFGKRVWANGFKEQLAYLYVFMLCMLHIIFYPLIIDIRKGNLMTPSEIKEEAVVYNEASYYFMGDKKSYRYFPSELSYLRYMDLRNSDYNESGEYNGNRQETYYIEELKPLIEPYLSSDGASVQDKYARDVQACPKLYMVAHNSLTEVYYDHPDNTVKEKDDLHIEKYQLKKKSDAERLADITKFIKLQIKYGWYDSSVHIDTPEEILQKYKSNQFNRTIYLLNTIAADYPIPTVDGELETADDTTEVSHYNIGEVHNAISMSQEYKWSHLHSRFIVTFFVALSLSVLLFLFKNVRLRAFILLFVYTGLAIFAVTMLNVIFHGRDGFPIHITGIIFFTGIYFSFFDRKAKQYSSIKTVLILLSNFTFAYAPIAIFQYLHEYHDIGKIYHESFYYENYCSYHQDICDQYDFISALLFQCCLWGGVAIYLFAGSILYKKVYERLWALPFSK